MEMEMMDMEMMKGMSFFGCVAAVLVAKVIWWGGCKLFCKK